MPPLSDADRIDTSIGFVPVHIAVLTVSDTRTKDDDVSGDTLEKRLKEAGHILCARTILPDDQAKIAAQLKLWIADPRIDVVISTGGTGLTGRDVTVEAFKSVFEKEIDGFAALFHQIAGLETAVELPTDHLVPAILAGTIGTGQRENHRSAGDAGAGA